MLAPRRRSRCAAGPAAAAAAAGRAVEVSSKVPGWQGNARGPPWLAPVILPSHSSARDINNNSTSGFTLLSRVNPFHCSVAGRCTPGPRSPSHLRSNSSSCQSSFLRRIQRRSASPFQKSDQLTENKKKRRVLCWHVTA